MQIPDFKLESYFATWEFKAKTLLCASDVERFSMEEILKMADVECKGLWEGLSLGYTETAGSPLLREEISEMTASSKAEDVLCFAGAEEGIYCTMRALLKKGDHVIVITPCYQSLEILPRIITENVSTIELKPEKSWELDLNQVKEAIGPNTRMLIMNYPHNPTGALLTKEQLSALINLARKHQLILFSDEVYRYLELDEQDRLPQISDLYEWGISLSVTSKAFGLGGLRIGWIVLRDKELLQKIAKYKHYTSLCNSGPSEILALIALRNRESILASRREIVRKNVLKLDLFFERQSARFSWARPKSGPICFVELRTGKDSPLFCRKVLDDLGILLLPATVYNSSLPYFRIGFGRENMPQALERFEAYIEEKMS